MVEVQPQEEKQCRICLDGVEAEPELGRLISPCKCRGSIRYVHVECLKTWRKSAQASSAFFACQQCRYQYRTTRTMVFGLGTNPIVVGALSGLVFTVIVMLASYTTTYFMSWFDPDQPQFSSDWTSHYFFVSPWQVAQDLITAAFRILQDEGILEEDLFAEGGPTLTFRNGFLDPDKESRFLMWFIKRFVVGLPLLGAASITHIIWTAHALLPVQMLARSRGRNRRGRDGRDRFTTLIIVGLILAGIIKTFQIIYRMTETQVKRFLVKAEDAILEVQ